jgi:threonine dehydratase
VAYNALCGGIARRYATFIPYLWAAGQYPKTCNRRDTNTDIEDSSRSAAVGHRNGATNVIPFDWFQSADARLGPHIKQTPLTFDAVRGLLLKWENRQLTGSFKVRGALNKILSLDDWERERGLVAASAGNHGQGVALAAQLTHSHAEVFVPEHAMSSKVDRMRTLEAEVHLVKGGYGEAEDAAKVYAERERKTFISPYNDAQIIAGQGTLALETSRQMGELRELQDYRSAMASAEHTWLVPVGGGGLIAGCGAVLAERGVSARIVGVQPAASAFTYNLFHRGTQSGIEDNPTLADGLSGRIDADSITIPMLRDLVNDMVVVSEDEIERAIALAWNVYQQRVEGSAAVTLAALLGGQVKARPCVVVLSGGNIDDDVFDAILRKHKGEKWN